MEQITWHNEKRKPTELCPFEYNPRTLSQKGLDRLKASIDKFGFVEIPVINTDNTIIAGHQRVNTLILLGLGDDEIDVRVPSRPLAELEIKEYNLRSNKNVGDWDFDCLANNFDTEILFNVGFDLPTIGEKELEPTKEQEANKKIILKFNQDDYARVKMFLESQKDIMECDTIEQVMLNIAGVM